MQKGMQLKRQRGTSGEDEVSGGEQWGDGGRGAAGKQASIEREECSKVQRYEISRDKL